MKKILLVSQFIIITLLVSCTQNVKTTTEKPYGEKNGIVKYKPVITGDVKITQTNYFEDYGKNEVTETIIENNNGSVTLFQHIVTVRLGNVFYKYAVSNKVNGKETANKEMIKVTVPYNALEQHNILGFTPEMKKKFDYKEDGTEKVAGYKGIKYSLSPDTVNHTERVYGVLYKNIPLKVAMQSMEFVAEKADFNVAIPTDKFKIPAGYKEIDPMQEPMPINETDTTANKK